MTKGVKAFGMMVTGSRPATEMTFYYPDYQSGENTYGQF